MNTPIDRAIEAAGGKRSGIAAIAGACGVTKQFIHKMRRHWADHGCAPRAMREHAAAIERACKGAVLAEELCPGVIWHRGNDGQLTHYAVAVGEIDVTSEAKVA